MGSKGPKRWWLAVALGALSGCAIVHAYTAANVPRQGAPGPVRPTRATQVLTEADLSQGAFIGIAMSGGGARAANFSAATLLELEKLGFLRHASALSAVSGSALTAAYYGLYAGPEDAPPPPTRATHWNLETVRERFAVDLQTHWLVRWFNPWNVVRYWFTDFDRSDIMKGVFDTYLFQGTPPFAALGTGRPKILINATSLPGVGSFVFTDEAFEKIGSRLDDYPLSHAVMASGAFPGAFHNVTLHNFAAPGYYQHLFDGGPSDNLGVLTLLTMVDAVKPKRGCFLFVVDAFPYQVGKGQRKSDTRGFTDFFVDRNVSDSANVLLTLRRYDTLYRRLGYKGTTVGEITQWPFTTDEGVDCRVWHLTFQTLVARAFARRQEAQQARQNLRDTLRAENEVNLIPTRYRLEGPKGMSEREVQTLLFTVANHLIHEDADTLKRACQWFAERGLATACAAAAE